MVTRSGRMGLNLKNIGEKIVGIEAFRPILALIVLMLVSSMLSPFFATTKNLMTILNQMAVITTAVLGEALIILMGSIDLSPGSQIGLGCLLTASLLEFHYFGLEMTIFMVLLVGMMVGFSNGIFISKGRVPSFIVTLACLSIVRGAIFIYCSYNIPIFHKTFLSLGRPIGLLPKLFIILMVVAIIFFLIEKFFKFSLYIRAIGGNEMAARNLGIDVAGIKTLAYTLAGLCYALAGLMLAVRLGASYPNAGYGYELDVIAAVVVGGISLAGGKGSLVGAFAGSMLMVTIVNVMVLLGIDPFWQWVVKGGVIVAAGTVYRGALPFAR